MARQKRKSQSHKNSFPLRRNFSLPALLLLGCLWVGYQIYQEYAFPVIVQEKQNIKMHACFVPNHNCQQKLIQEIDKAQNEILVMCYNFNDKKIAEALLRAKDRGLSIEIVADKTQKNHMYSQIPLLRRKKIPVYCDDNVTIAHNKVMVMDGSLIITGSFNFTDSAQRRNAENLLFVTSQELAQQYKTYWKSRRDVSQKLSPKWEDKAVHNSS